MHIVRSPLIPRLLALWLALALALAWPSPAVALRPRAGGLEERTAATQALSRKLADGTDAIDPERVYTLVRQIVRRHPPLGAGYAAIVCPFPGHADLVIKIPKTLARVLWKVAWSGAPFREWPRQAWRLKHQQLPSYRRAQAHGAGVVAPFRVYEFPHHRLPPYVVVQQSGRVLGEELREIMRRTHVPIDERLAECEGWFQQHLALREAALAQGIWEPVGNLTINNVIVYDGGRRVLRIADAGEVWDHPPTLAQFARADQWFVVNDLRAIDDRLVTRYQAMIQRQAAPFTESTLRHAWNRRPTGHRIEFPEADAAIRALLAAGGLEEPTDPTVPMPDPATATAVDVADYLTRRWNVPVRQENGRYLVDQWTIPPASWTMPAIHNSARGVDHRPERRLGDS